MSTGPYGDPAVDEIVDAAEYYARWEDAKLIRDQIDLLAALPESPARTAGRARLEALLAGAASRYVPPPPAPYVEFPPRKEPEAVAGTLVSVGEFRRAPCTAQQFKGYTADEVRAVLGSPDSERQGRDWFSHEKGRHLSRVGDELIEGEVWGPVPNLEPGRPYFIWTYDMILDPGEPDPEPGNSPMNLWILGDAGNTWLLYFFASEGQPTVVFEAGSIPRSVQF